MSTTHNLLSNSNINNNWNYDIDDTAIQSHGFEVLDKSFIDLCASPTIENDDHSGPISSSTQIVDHNLNNQALDINNNQKICINKYSNHDKFNEDKSGQVKSLYSSESFKQGLLSLKNSMLLKIKVSRCNIDNNPNYVWNKVKDDIAKQMSQLNLSSVIEKYTIKYYLNKLYKYNLINPYNPNTIVKIPFLCAYVKTVVDRSLNATVLLKDQTGDEILCALSTNIIKPYPHTIRIGTVLMLQNIAIVRVSLKKDGNHLNANIDNLLDMYSLNMEDETPDIKYLKVLNIDSNQINKNINDFEYNLRHGRESDASNRRASSPPRVASMSSLVNDYNFLDKAFQSAPPIRQHQLLNSKSDEAPLNTAKSFTFKRKNKDSETITDGSGKRKFVFHKTSNSLPHKPTEAVQNIPQSSIALSKEEFSKLISGFEDELFKDD